MCRWGLKAVIHKIGTQNSNALLRRDTVWIPGHSFIRCSTAAQFKHRKRLNFLLSVAPARQNSCIPSWPTMHDMPTDAMIIQWITGNDVEGSGCGLLEILPGICLEELKTLRKSPGLRFQTEYEGRVLTTRQRHSVWVIMTCLHLTINSQEPTGALCGHESRNAQNSRAVRSLTYATTVLVGGR
jgi:hypothetical protein